VPPVTVGHFAFIFGATGGYDDALVVDLSTNGLYNGSPEAWLQDSRNYPPPLGFSADDIRAMLVAHAPDTLAAVAAQHSEGAVEAHQASLAVRGGAESESIDAGLVFAPEAAAEHGLGLGLLLGSGHYLLPPPLDAIHPAIA
jgi:hypothetical protein